MVKKRYGKVGGFSEMTFGERVILIACAIPKGRVMTYGGIARAAGGAPITAQSITGILGRAYERGVKEIPFHRIVYANGTVWLDASHTKQRMKLYEAEGIEVTEGGRIVNFREKVFDPYAA